MLRKGTKSKVVFCYAKCGIVGVCVATHPFITEKDFRIEGESLNPSDDNIKVVPVCYPLRMFRLHVDLFESQSEMDFGIAFYFFFSITLFLISLFFFKIFSLPPCLTLLWSILSSAGKRFRCGSRNNF
mmetsp:Transcript_24549/g.33745  ORF Transcript_24549/g.33745 Transcript_24549/m.33745 type:complete len:128 (+) Transcript_24549:1567-1950(+)